VYYETAFQAGDYGGDYGITARRDRRCAPDPALKNEKLITTAPPRGLLTHGEHAGPGGGPKPAYLASGTRAGDVTPVSARDVAGGAALAALTSVSDLVEPQTSSETG
jgi:hypothetical protein